MQVTPHNSEASIIFGKGVTSAKPGSAQSLVLGVDDIDTARDDLVARGVDVSEVFHYAGGPFNNAMENPRVSGRDPEKPFQLLVCLVRGPGRERLAAARDQEATSRPRMETNPAQATDVATLAELLHETAKHQDHYEKTHAEHHWWDWYASYLSARQSGNSPEEAAAAAERNMEEVLRVLPR